MSAPNQPKSGSDFRKDFLSSIVVFLVALPLCLGISIACGVPPAQGLMTGIIAGIVVGFLSGVPLQVSGPAAGLTVLVWDVVQRHGLEALAVVILAGGAIQLIAGFFKLGRWFRAVSPAVIQAMLAGIGILLAASQFHVMLDYTPSGSGLPNLIAIPSAIANAIMLADGGSHLMAAGLALFTLAVLVLWKWFHFEEKTHMPGHLPAIVGATLIAFGLRLPVNYVNVPDNLLSATNITGTDALSLIIQAPILLAALSLALIASAETLLSATAVDQMHQGKRAQYDRELIAQGIGNMLCGVVGALPITGVIARSTVNVQAGARTRRSAILHGVWILLAVAALPFVLNAVPIASLAALLVYTGAKLIDMKAIKALMSFGRGQLMIYGATVVVIVAADLLTGVLVGFALSLVRLVLTMTDLQIERSCQTKPEEDDPETDDDSGAEAEVSKAKRAGILVLSIRGTATFLGLPKLAEALESLPADANVRIETDDLVYIDHACLDLIANFEKRHTAGGGTLAIDKLRLEELSHSPAGA